MRRLGSGDWRVLRDMRLRALTDTPSSFGMALDVEVQRDQTDWTDALTREVWFVTGPEESPSGIAGYYPEDRYPDGYPQLGSMWIAPRARGTGLARALTGAIGDHAGACGETGVGLWVMFGNDHARRVYQRLGFTASAASKPAPRDPEVMMLRMTMRVSARPSEERPL